MTGVPSIQEMSAISAGWAVNYFWVADCFGDDIFSARFGDAGVAEEMEEGKLRKYFTSIFEVLE